MANKLVKLPIVGDDVLYHMNGTVRPAKVLAADTSGSTYLWLLVMAASDGTPTGLDKCAPVFSAYSEHGSSDGCWEWRDDMNFKRMVAEVNESGQTVATKLEGSKIEEQEEQPVPVPVVESIPAETVPSIPPGVGGALSPESNLGRIVDMQLHTIRAATSKLMDMKKNGRLKISGSDADVEQYQTMVEAIGKSEVELRTVLFGA